MTTTNDVYDDTCPENTGVEQVWSGDVFVGYQVFMDENEYRQHLSFKNIQEIVKQRGESLANHLAEIGAEE
jgi:uncharacterized protein YukE